ncbi:DUF924 family protein [Rhodanobacter lindaniclasticus]
MRRVPRLCSAPSRGDRALRPGFPHRNAVLGRDSTAAEREYLAQPGAGF